MQIRGSSHETPTDHIELASTLVILVWVPKRQHLKRNVIHKIIIISHLGV